ncbi:hypothetical protein ACC782_34805 [Rhizobium ruizarguesonis]
MFRLFRSKEPEVPTLDSLEALKKFVNTAGATKSGEVIRKEALSGNLLCQIFLSQASLQFNRLKDAEVFTKLAAENGDANSQANLALIYIKQVDPDCDYYSDHDIALIKNAIYWHGKAAAQGFEPSIVELKNLTEAFPSI